MSTFLASFEYYEDRGKIPEELALLTAVRQNTGVRINPYSAPKKNVVDNFQKLFEALHDENLQLLKQQLYRLDMVCKRFRAANDVLICFPKKKKDIHVSFFWRVGDMKIPGKPETYNNPVDPLVLEDPHEGYDGVDRISSEMFAGTKARVMIMNAIHSHSSGEKVHCKSDGAHNRDTLFFKAHVKLEQMYPFSFFVQLHGMVRHANMHMLVVNGFSSRFTTERKSGATLFAQELPNYFPLETCETFSICSDIPGTAFGKPLTRVFRRPTGCHNTNVEGRQLSDRKDSGRFMHIELDPKFRTSDKGPRTNLVETLDATMKNWVEITERFIEVDPDNVEIEDVDEECKECGEDCENCGGE